jgi:hypothetical protein
MKGLAALLLLLGSVATARAGDPPPTGRDYFNQFLYVDNATDPDGNPATRYLYLWNPIVIQVDPAGAASLYARMDLFLLKDGSFVLKYVEGDDLLNPIPQPIPYIHYTGGWSVSGDTLIVGDIATGAAGDGVTGPGVTLTFTRDLISPGLKGKGATLDYCYSVLTPWDP